MAVGGVANFTDLGLNSSSPTGYILRFNTSVGVGAFRSFLAIDSQRVPVSGRAAALVLTSPDVPSTVVAGTPLDMITGRLEYDDGSLVTLSNVRVQLALQGSTRPDGLRGERTQVARGGEALFPGLQVAEASFPRSFSLRMSAPSLGLSASTNSFVVVPNKYVQLLFTSEPLDQAAGQAVGPVHVSIADAFQNPTDTFNVLIILETVGPQTVSEEQFVQQGLGYAVFAALTVSVSGEYALSARFSFDEAPCLTSAEFLGDDPGEAALICGQRAQASTLSRTFRVLAGPAASVR
eukprot:3321286-Rhodomonas_salina.1